MRIGSRPTLNFTGSTGLRSLNAGVWILALPCVARKAVTMLAVGERVPDKLVSRYVERT